MLLILAAAPSDVDGRTRLSGAPRMRAVISEAQDTCVELDFIPPPPPNHTHHITPHLAPGWGMVLYPEEYIRCGGVTFLGTIIPVDIDYCDGEGTCGLWNREAYQGSEVVGWSDGGAGGLFGRIDPQLGFVEEQDPSLVTHYRAGAMPGIVELSAWFDDIEGDFEEGIPFADDEPSWSEPTEITVWDFTIDRPDVRPIYNQTLAFNVAIRPTLDHKDSSMGRQIAFTLNNVSQEPGYCLNKTVEDGVEWRRTTADDNDLKIDPDENEGMTVTGAPNYAMALTADAVIEATLTVRCLDFGAWGTVRAQVMGSIGNEFNTIYARLDTTPVSNPINEAHFPVDEDGTDIWDGWTDDGDPDDDDDPEPENHHRQTQEPAPGDSLSRYEEYRGALVDGEWSDTDPEVKDVWIYNIDELDCSVIETFGLAVHYVSADDFGFVPWPENQLEDQDEDGETDEDPVNGVDDDDDGLVDEDPSEELWPSAYDRGPVNRFTSSHHSAGEAHPIVIGYWYRPVPMQVLGHLPGRVMIAVSKWIIRQWTNPTHDTTTTDQRDEAVYRLAIGNDLGNAINMQDHNDAGGQTTRNCVMWDNDVADDVLNYDPIPQVYCPTNPGDILLWYLRHPE